MEHKEPIFSAKVKAGKMTYFVDVKESQNGNNYLAITERRFEEGKNKYTNIRVFGDKVAEFAQAVNEAMEVLAKA